MGAATAAMRRGGRQARLSSQYEPTAGRRGQEGTRERRGQGPRRGGGSGAGWRRAGRGRSARRDGRRDGRVGTDAGTGASGRARRQTWRVFLPLAALVALVGLDLGEVPRRVQPRRLGRAIEPRPRAPPAPPPALASPLGELVADAVPPVLGGVRVQRASAPVDLGWAAHRERPSSQGPKATARLAVGPGCSFSGTQSATGGARGCGFGRTWGATPDGRAARVHGGHHSSNELCPD